MEKSNKKQFILFGVIIVIVVIAVLIFRFMSGVSLYKDEHTTGNTSGNLLNGGLFCEVDDTIYFANPIDNGVLYSMNQDLEKIKRVSTDNVSYLNGAGPYLFYTKRNDKKTVDSDAIMQLSSTGLYRMKRRTKALATLYKGPTQVACLYGNNVYYQHFDPKKGLLLYSAKIDGKDDKQIRPEPCAPTAIDNGYIYYTGMNEDHYIHMISTSGGGDTVLYGGGDNPDANCTGLSKQGDYLYFLDMSEDYALKRIPANGSSFAETLTDKHIATYNVSPNEDVIYCQVDNGSENGLYELDITTGNLNPIASGNYNYLHLTKDYLFYEEFDQSKVYAMNLATNASKELELPDGKKK